MDDRTRPSWFPNPLDPKKPQTSSLTSSGFATLRPSPPASGRVTPLNGATSNPSSKPTTPANDSFSNLVSFSSSSTTKNLSLLEQQKRLAEQKTQNSGKSKGLNEKLWGGDEDFWNNLGSGRSTPAPPSSSQKTGPGDQTGKIHNHLIDEDEDDLFADLNAPVPGDSNTKGSKWEDVTRVPSTTSTAQRPNDSRQDTHLEDDDDPFGLAEFQAKKSIANPRSSTFSQDDDDVLGLLGQPASRKPQSPLAEAVSPAQDTPSHPQEKAVAELVDMGFQVEKARQALESTESGLDVPAAVSWLLNQAHAEAQEKSKARDTSRNGMGRDSAMSSHRHDSRGEPEPSRTSDQPWSNDGESLPPRRRDGTTSQKDRDPTQAAAELGTTLLKSAGSLWKQGQKKVQQAYQEFNSDSDSSQPKWMRDPDRAAKSEARTQSRTDEAGIARRRRRSSAAQQKASVTDEALMLELNGPPSRRPMRPQADSRVDSSANSSRDHSPALPSRLRQSVPATPAFLQQQQQRPPPPSTKQTLNRQAVEEQASQAYVSSARRRKPAAPPPMSVSEPDLLDGVSRTLPSRPSTTVASQPVRAASPVVVVRPPAPTRLIPPISSISLKASHSHREAGNAHFKRGDYSSAHQSYTTSLSHLPATHPITVILLTNHALTALKCGEPKSAITSADKAISVIGPSKGDGESVHLQNGDAPKPMRDYYGKALMRKAEALEQMERWTEAASVWREAVEGGHGGATSIQGRMRAEKAASPATVKQKPAPVRKPAAPVRKQAVASVAGSATAVNRLRAANAAADKVDDEKFALADAVDARIAAWKGGKADNLRALLGSLDAVLWPEAGWKKISMADLVLPAKVKIQYMKGIAKVHPDKIPTTATTEHRMIAGAVFSILNEAWDKFKMENGL